MKKIVSYEKEHDILVVHKGFDYDEKFMSNFDIGDLILDVSTKGRIRGIEIMNASEFLKEFHIGKSVLNNIKDAKLNAQIGPNSITLGLVIKSKDGEIPAKIALPLQTPLAH